VGVWRSVGPATTGEPSPLPRLFRPRHNSPHARVSQVTASCASSTRMYGRKRCLPTITRLSNCKADMCRLRCWSGPRTTPLRSSWLVCSAFLPANVHVGSAMAALTCVSHRVANRLQEGERRQNDREKSCTRRMGHRLHGRCNAADHEAATVGSSAGRGPQPRAGQPAQPACS